MYFRVCQDDTPVYQDDTPNLTHPIEMCSRGCIGMTHPAQKVYIASFNDTSDKFQR